MAVQCKYDKTRVIDVSFYDRTAEVALSVNEGYFLFLLRRGELAVSVNGRTHPLRAPCMLALNERDTVIFEPAGGIEAMAIEFNPSFLNINVNYDMINNGAYAENMIRYGFVALDVFTVRTEAFAGILPLTEDEADTLSGYFLSFRDAVRGQPDVRWSCRARMNLSFVLELLHQMYMAFSGIAPYDVKDTARWVAILLDRIHAHYWEPLSLSTLSRFIGINKTTVSIAFRQRTGMAVTEYVLAYRIRCAKLALATTELKVSEIGEQCGFNSTAYFIKQFRFHTGMTPKAYRQETVRLRKRELQSDAEERGGSEEDDCILV